MNSRSVHRIGTGASASQYVPEIQPHVEKLYVVQRTAPWVMPHGDRPITDAERVLYRHVPLAQRLGRAAVDHTAAPDDQRTMRRRDDLCGTFDFRPFGQRPPDAPDPLGEQ